MLGNDAQIPYSLTPTLLFSNSLQVATKIQTCHYWKDHFKTYPHTYPHPHPPP